MFNFLKDKLKGWFKSAEGEEKAKPKKIKGKAKEKVEKTKPAKKELKLEHKKRTKQELEEERKVGGDLIEDIKKEKGTDEIKAVPMIEIEKTRVEEKADEIKEELVEEVKEEKRSFFKRIFGSKYTIKEEDFNEFFESLELILLENNVALEAVDYLRDNLKNELVNKEVDKNDVEKTIKKALKKSIESLFAPTPDIIEKIKEKDGVFVIVFFGINGSGKTTTIAKLAYLLQKNKIETILAAGDTFRAASIEQLIKHGDKLGIKVIKQNYGSDPAAVAYDAIEYAKAHKIKVVLVDTAGRMHTKDNLMKEMSKIIKVSKPDLKVFVAEATLGNDAIEQAKTFNETIGIDGIILSKQDIDEKGGTSLSVSKVTGKPILFLGVGQEYKDLEVFNREKLMKALGL